MLLSRKFVARLAGRVVHVPPSPSLARRLRTDLTHRRSAHSVITSPLVRDLSIMASLRVSFQEVATERGSAPPLPRSGHVSATLPAWHEHDVIVFGGYVEDANKNRSSCNEGFTFSSKDNRWHPIKWAKGPLPKPRIAGQAVVVGDSLYLIAGWDTGAPGTGGEILADVWRLNLRDWSWETVQPQGEGLEPISRFQAVAIGKQIWIHNHRSVEDVLVLDTATAPPTLSKVPVQGTSPEHISPPSRGLHSMTLLGNRLWLFGGAGKSGPMLSDLWSLDLDSRAWTLLHPVAAAKDSDDIGAAGTGDQSASGHSSAEHVPAAAAAAPARCSHLALAVGGRYIVYFGGAFYQEAGKLQPLGDTHAYDTAENRWVRIELHGKPPSPRNAASLSPLHSGGTGTSALIYGGWYPFKETYNDTFRMDVEVLHA